MNILTCCIIITYIYIYSIFPTRINKTTLLILRLRLLTPVRRLVFPTLFFLVAFLFRLVYGFGIVFGGGVDRVEDLR